MLTGRMDNPDLGLLLARLGLGSVLFVHGVGKLFAAGPAALPIADFAGMLGGMGLPAAVALAWLVALVETFGGLAIVGGIFTRCAATLAAVDMLAALYLVHLSNGFPVSNNGYEFVLVLAATSLALVFTGPGSYSLQERLGIEELDLLERLTS